MLDNTALNVVIGLVFIYLLYSLLASVLSEIIATYLGLRARNLKEAVDRMLNDEDDKDKNFLSRLWDSLKLMKNPKNPRITNFYNHPEIKYLGSTGIFKQPSQFKSISFSRTLLILLNEIGYKKLHVDDSTKMHAPEEGDIPYIPALEVTKQNIEAALKGIREDHRDENVTEKNKIVLDEETAKYVQSLWYECYGDLIKFNLKLENWFNRTMEQCTEWYKRKIQIVLLVLGFMLAWFFNADTFTIIHKLSTDKDARDKMVTLAAAYIEANPERPAQANPDSNFSQEKVDSLMAVQKKLQEDINNANTVLGLGGWPADSVLVKREALTNKLVFMPLVDEEVVMNIKGEEIKRKTDDEMKKGVYIKFDSSDKFSYFGNLFPLHFFGFLITAIAISLGAPFWFDMLNKLMALRTSKKQPTDVNSATTTVTTVSPLNREG